MSSRRALLCVLLRVATASAEEAPPVDPAEALLAEGTRLFTEEADYGGALERFQQSYARRPTWKALNGQALVYQQRGLYVEALESYERLLAEFGAALTPKQRATVDDRAAELARKVGVLDVEVAQEDTRLSIDGREVAPGPSRREVRLLPGPHHLLATRDGFQPLTRTVAVRAGERTVERVVLAPLQVLVKTEAARLVRRFPRFVPWLTLGAGVALAAVGGILSASAAADFARFDEQVQAQAGSPPRQVDLDRTSFASGENKRDAAYALYAVGAAAAGAAVVLFVLNLPRPETRRLPDARALLVPTPGGLSLFGRF